MTFELEFVLFSAVIPAITALVVALGLQWLLPNVWGARTSLAFAAAAGCVAGYVLLPEWAPLTPERHWQWIYYATVVAAMVGSVLAVKVLPRWGQAALLLPMGIVVAWQVVPTSNSYEPPRSIMLPVMAGYLALLALLLVWLPERLRGRTFCAILAATALATTLLVAAEVSLKIGHAAAIATTTLAGCAVAAWFLQAKREANALAAATLGLIPVFVVACGGFAYAGGIDPMEPVWILLIIPAAPLMLWLFAWGPLSHVEGVAAIVLQTIVVAIIPLVIGVWLLLPGEATENDEWSQANAKMRVSGTND